MDPRWEGGVFKADQGIGELGEAEFGAGDRNGDLDEGVGEDARQGLGGVGVVNVGFVPEFVAEGGSGYACLRVGDWGWRCNCHWF